MHLGLKWILLGIFYNTSLCLNDCDIDHRIWNSALVFQTHCYNFFLNKCTDYLMEFNLFKADKVYLSPLNILRDVTENKVTRDKRHEKFSSDRVSANSVKSGKSQGIHYIP